MTPSDIDRDALEEILEGLRLPQKKISPKFFYDERGSKLFDRITELPEYYLTDSEIDIMQAHVGEIAELVGKRASLIEFGAGSGMKTRILLEHLDELAAYVPVDVSEEFLLASAADIQKDFPHIEVLPVVADFLQPFDLPNPKVMPVKNIVYFPGSTIGNFERRDALSLLNVMHHEAKEGGALLIGADLQKDPDIIDAAYNDSEGITEEFNKNMLRHLNRDFGADFDIDAFEHSANYDEGEGRVVIKLVSTKAQTVQVGGEAFTFAAGESILTEYSHKYTLAGFAKLVGEAGFEVQRVWTDDKKLFSVQYCTRIA